jgi:hypothetical protein
MEFRLYNGQFEPVTIYPEDIQITFGNRPNAPGPWEMAEGFDEMIILPGQAMDLSITWVWEGQMAFATLELLKYRFALTLE